MAFIIRADLEHIIFTRRMTWFLVSFILIHVVPLSANGDASPCLRYPLQLSKWQILVLLTCSSALSSGLYTMTSCRAQSTPNLTYHCSHFTGHDITVFYATSAAEYYHTSNQRPGGKQLTQTKSMRQPLLTNHHPRPRPIPHRNNLIPRLLRNPMVIPSKVKEHLGQWFTRRRYTPDIVAPFVCCDCVHFVGGHVSVYDQISTRKGD